MLTEVLSSYGENLVKNNIIDKIAFTRKPIAIYFVLSEEGELLEKVEPEKLLFEYIPISFFGDSFSTARVSENDIVFPLFEQISTFSRPERKELFFEEIKNFREEINDEKINIISNFILNYDWDEDISDWTAKQSNFVYVYIKKQGKNVSITDDSILVNKINKWLLDKITSDFGEVDLLGHDLSSDIRKHSTIKFDGPIQPRLISEKAYKEKYYWKEKRDGKVCVISPKTELYFDLGIKYLQDNASTQIHGRYFALNDINSDFYVPLYFNMSSFSKRYGFEVEGKKDWDEFKEWFLKKCRNVKLLYVEFDNFNQGRISQYQVYKYNEIESEEILLNIIEYVEKTTIFRKGEIAFSLQKTIIEVIDRKYGYQRGNNEGIFFGDAKTNIKFNQEYSRYIRMVLEGNYERISTEYVLPDLVQKIKAEEKEEIKKDIYFMATLNQKELNNQNIRNSIDYMFGELLASFHMYEMCSRNNNSRSYDELTFVQKKITSLKANPYRALIILEDVKRRYKNRDSKRQYYFEKRIIRTKNELLALGLNSNTRCLNNEVFVGFENVLNNEYLKHREPDEVVYYLSKIMDKNNIQVEVLSEDKMENLSRDSKIEYRVIIQEYIKQKENGDA